MGKLKLDVEALQVESFDALPARRARGTVAGHLMEDGPYYQDPFVDWEGGGGGGGGGYTLTTCIGPTFCCTPGWDCPNPNTASRVVSAIVSPCTCQP